MAWAGLRLAFLLLSCSSLSATSYANGAGGRVFSFANECEETVWVGTLGSAVLNGGGWAVAPGRTVSVTAPPGWHGRFWGRTGCRFDASGKGLCETGDCGGQAKCAGVGGQPPATLAEFSLGPPMDFYDISLVDGYNLRVSVAPIGGKAAGSGRGGPCQATGCDADVNKMCPKGLRVGGGSGGRAVVACRSACNAFSQPQFCCTGAYATPMTCRASSFSRLFKRACPHAYTFAYDDPSSIFTCSAPHAYLITFCS